jgi:hypothetical protein
VCVCIYIYKEGIEEIIYDRGGIIPSRRREKLYAASLEKRERRERGHIRMRKFTV